ncbi:MAG: toxin YoeB [Thiothrix lacustris]|uniref:Toxin YoeB n=1 Tax=Thiothrix lacustris TaxID=525917 RepID=A0A1Y1QK95_9GAMM|nr:MAG: toxin YoeB [Thiothrix lacustris]
MICFEEQGWEDYQHWQQTDRKVLKRVNELIRDIQRDPFNGIGKPEPLRHNLSGCWSRRITDTHRLVYMVQDSQVIILQCRFHY